MHEHEETFELYKSNAAQVARDLRELADELLTFADFLDVRVDDATLLDQLARLTEHWRRFSLATLVECDRFAAQMTKK